jgi:hypothetical protein
MARKDPPTHEPPDKKPPETDPHPDFPPFQNPSDAEPPAEKPPVPPGGATFEKVETNQGSRLAASRRGAILLPESLR